MAHDGSDTKLREYVKPANGCGYTSCSSGNVHFGMLAFGNVDISKTVHSVAHSKIYTQHIDRIHTYHKKNKHVIMYYVYTEYIHSDMYR